MVQTQISLSEKEVGIILELLRQEQHELPVEMRHTRSSDYHDELHERQGLINTLVARLEKESSGTVA